VKCVNTVNTAPEVESKQSRGGPEGEKVDTGEGKRRKMNSILVNRVFPRMRRDRTIREESAEKMAKMLLNCCVLKVEKKNLTTGGGPHKKEGGEIGQKDVDCF